KLYKHYLLILLLAKSGGNISPLIIVAVDSTGIGVISPGRVDVRGAEEIREIKPGVKTRGMLPRDRADHPVALNVSASG
ncbi:MAG TPA: hypothetical protein PLN56_06600, partial [Methanoregulaceae archaeon]|nr:hypothetical protein [Methanoregulaceae archaeon]